MANGETKLLRDVRPGDRVLAMNSEQQVVEDVVMMMLDSQPNRPGEPNMVGGMTDRSLSLAALFYSIETELGHRLSLTGSHFVAVQHHRNGDADFVPAHQVKPSDIVLINEQGQLRPVTVRNVSEIFRVGYFTPMTGQGETVSF